VWAAGVLMLAACGKDRTPSKTDRALPAKAPTPPPPATGPEALLLRVPRTGGIATAYDYEHPDSAIWTSAERVPAISRVLAFDEDGGAVAVVDGRGAPRRIELRSGSVSPPPDVKLTVLRSADGASVYGVSTGGLVTRLTPTDTRPWTFRAPLAARDVAPQADGSLLIIGDGPGGVRVWRIRPPGTALLDSTSLPHAEHLVRAEVGDRAYFVSDSALQGVRARDLKPAPPVHFERRLRAMVPTPSGDRLFVALDSVSVLRVIDRYSGEQTSAVQLPGPPGELRMDSLGRFLLVRPTHYVDSAWVVAVGTDRVVGHVRTAWTADIPFVGADGAIVVAQGPDVLFLDPQTFKPRRTVAGGARDFWIPLRWSGFRPRAAGLDQPVTFPTTAADTTDSILSAIRRSQRDTAVRAAAPPPAPTPSPSVVDSAQGRLGTGGTRVSGFTVQFAALLNPDTARARASRIVANGQHARVVSASRGGTMVYLVVLGPYSTREAAEAAGQASRQPSPWVYEGAP
jgi:cell division septation protein DedD